MKERIHIRDYLLGIGAMGTLMTGMYAAIGACIGTAFDNVERGAYVGAGLGVAATLTWLGLFVSNKFREHKEKIVISRNRKDISNYLDEE